MSCCFSKLSVTIKYQIHRHTRYFAMLTHDSDCLNVFEIPRSTSIPTLLQTTFYIVNTNSQNWFLIGTKLREICVMHCLHSLICFFNTSRVCCSGHVQILKYLFLSFTKTRFMFLFECNEISTARWLVYYFYISNQSKLISIFSMHCIWK